MPSLRVTFDADEARREIDQIPADRLIYVEEPDWQLIGIDHGMSSGRAAIALRINLPDGRVLVVDSSAAVWIAAAQALKGRYPAEDPGPSMTDAQFAEVQALLAAQLSGALGIPAELLKPTGDHNRGAAGAPSAMASVVAGQTCQTCGKPAAVVYHRGGRHDHQQYFCDEHSPLRPKGEGRA